MSSPQVEDLESKVDRESVLVSISRGRLKMLIDKEDYSKVTKYKWKALKNHSKDKHKQKMYVARSEDRFDATLNRRVYKTILLHRLLIEAPAGVLVDHIDGNSLNNRKSNLRLANNSQNLANKGLDNDSKRTFKGVRLSGLSKFESRITFHGTPVIVSGLLSEEEAAFCYDLMAKMLFKEFACPNFVVTPPLDSLAVMRVSDKVNKKLSEMHLC